MSETSTLIKQLQERAQRENAIIQDQTQKQVRELRNVLSATLQRELNTIKTDIDQQTKGLGWRIFKSRFLWPFITGLSLCLGILLGSWGVMRYQLERIQTMQTTVNQLEQDLGKASIIRCEGRPCIAVVTPQSYTANKMTYMIIEGY